MTASPLLPPGMAAGGFARRFQATGGIIICTVTWPESAASWLRQAARFAAADPDLWVMAGPATGWAQMTRRLLWSTPWRPQRLILIDLVLPRVTALSASRDTVHAAASKLRSAFLTPGPPT
jgi:hypothetical protein